MPIVTRCRPLPQSKASRTPFFDGTCFDGLVQLDRVARGNIPGMRTSALAFILAAVLATISLSAQQSPPARTDLTIGGSALSVRYSAPSVRGRQIFGAGGLLSQDPTYPVWRAGANDATTLRTDANLDVGGTAIPRGTYSLYVVVSDMSNWQLVVNRQTGQSGLDYDPSRDVARIRMTMSRPATPVETLKWTLSEAGPNRGELRLEWEQHVALVPFTVR